MPSDAGPGPSPRERLTRRLGRITWESTGDALAPGEALRRYEARLEDEAVRLRRRAQELEDTLAIVRDCIAALPPGMYAQGIEVGAAEGEGQFAEPAAAASPSPAEGTTLSVREPDPRAEPGAPIRAWLLGGFRISVDGGPTHAAEPTNAWRVLKFLASKGGGPVSAEVMADTFWRQSSASAALQSVYTAVSSLRKCLADLGLEDPVPSRGGFYTLAPGSRLLTDVGYFRDRVRRGAAAWARKDHGQARVMYEEAVEAYTGPFLLGEAYARWAADEREALAVVHLGALERLGDALQAEGDPDRAAGYWRQVLQQDALREPCHRALIRYYLASGQRPRAVKQFRELEGKLKRELGIEPGPETRELMQGLL